MASAATAGWLDTSLIGAFRWRPRSVGCSRSTTQTWPPGSVAARCATSTSRVDFEDDGHHAEPAARVVDWQAERHDRLAEDGETTTRTSAAADWRTSSKSGARTAEGVWIGTSSPRAIGWPSAS